MAVVICFKIEFQIGHEYFKCVSFVLSAPCHSTEVRLWRLKIFDLLCPSDFVHCGDSSLVKLNDQFDESQSVFDCSNAELCTQAHQKDHWIVAWISFREKIIIPLSSRSSLSVFFSVAGPIKDSVLCVKIQLRNWEHKGAHQWWTARLEHHGSTWKHLPQTAYLHGMHTAQCFS